MIGDEDCLCRQVSEVKKKISSKVFRGEIEDRQKYVMTVMLHFVKDGCGSALEIARDGCLENREHLNMMILLLLSQGEYDKCYNLIRWVASSSKASVERVLPCSAHRHLGADMNRFLKHKGWTPLQQWTQEADITEDLDWMLGTQGTIHQRK